MSQNDTDWALFRFPPRPGQAETDAIAPLWAVPPARVRTWYLDIERHSIVHPERRKRIDLNRVSTRARLCSLLQMAETEANDADLVALLRAITQAFQTRFGRSMAEHLANGPLQWQWPAE